MPTRVQQWRNARSSKIQQEGAMATKSSRFRDSSDAKEFSSTATADSKIDLQTPAQQAYRRASLIPQRTTSIKSHDVSRPQPRQPACRSDRNVSTTTVAGLQRSQSTKHFADLKQPEVLGHHRLSSLSCLTPGHPRNGLATRSSALTSVSRKQQFALPLSASTQPIASCPIYARSQKNFHGAAGPTSVEAGSNNEDGKESAERTQGEDTRRQPLTPNGHPKSTLTTKRLEAVNATADVPSADIRLVTPSAKSRRHAFSALQQEFGPRQVPTELRSRVPHSPDGGTTNQVSPEAVASILELLQLHMLHRSSIATNRQWESSAEKYYKSRFDGLASDHKSMTCREIILQEQINASAIIAWASGTEDRSIGNKIQKLSQILIDVVDVSGPSGQHTCLLNSFEHWYSNAVRIRQLRGRRGSIHPRIERTLEGIGDGWKAEADHLKSKLLVHQEELVFLGEAHPRSDLIRYLDALLGMLTNMLEELDVIQAIETQFLREEKDWLKDSLGCIAADISSGMSVPVNTGRHR
ncbi:hypothetical protein MMC11_005698 [Xylographa trunciseda]|nr:hypothetical protein [Xylographa trunciseda]